MPIRDKTSGEDLIKRLSRIEGQNRGLRMIAEDKPCMDILTQIAAARAALQKVGSLILEWHAVSCLEDMVSAQDREKAAEELSRAIKSLTHLTD